MPRFHRLLSALLALPGLAFAQPAAPTPADSASAIPRIERFHAPGQGSVNSWLIVGRESVAVVDVQRAIPEATALVEQIRRTGKPLRTIVLTHEHPDHIGGLDVLTQAFPAATVLASAPTTTFIRQNGPQMARQMREDFGFGERFPARIPVPTQLITHGQTLQLGDAAWQVVQLGAGEAASMSLLVQPEARLALVADLAGHRMTPWMVDGHVQQWIVQLDAAAVQLAGHTVYPGHGEAGSAEAVLVGQRQYLADFIAAVQRETSARGGPLSAEARQRIRAWADARYPGWLRVAPPPQLVEMNADAVAAELARP